MSTSVAPRAASVCMAALNARSTSASTPSPRNAFGTPMRKPFTSPVNAPSASGIGSGLVVASRRSAPPMTWNTSAASSADTVSGPI